MYSSNWLNQNWIVGIVNLCKHHQISYDFDTLNVEPIPFSNHFNVRTTTTKPRTLPLSLALVPTSMGHVWSNCEWSNWRWWSQVTSDDPGMSCEGTQKFDAMSRHQGLFRMVSQKRFCYASGHGVMGVFHHRGRVHKNCTGFPCFWVHRIFELFPCCCTCFAWLYPCCCASHIWPCVCTCCFVCMASGGRSAIFKRMQLTWWLTIDCVIAAPLRLAEMNTLKANLLTELSWSEVVACMFQHGSWGFFVFLWIFGIEGFFVVGTISEYQPRSHPKSDITRPHWGMFSNVGLNEASCVFFCLCVFW